MVSERFAICALEDIPNRRAMPFILAKRDDTGTVRPWLIFALRWGRNVRVFENRCPHQGSYLDWEKGEFLDASGTRILCGKHGSTFDLGTGIAVDGPCVGKALTQVAVEVDEDGDVCLLVDGIVEDDDFDSGQGLE